MEGGPLQKLLKTRHACAKATLKQLDLDKATRTRRTPGTAHLRTVTPES